MPDKKQYTEKTEVKTETKGSPVGDGKYKKETTVTTERKLEKEDDDKVIVIDD
jgi:hypothetical protein